MHMRSARLARAAALIGLLIAGLTVGLPRAHASALRLCAGPDTLGPVEKDRILRFGAVVKQELERSGHTLALIARSGTDLSRFDTRYSHAGISLRESANTPWSVRQLYYACDESQPRIFDQGIAGFVLGTDRPALGYVSLVFLPTQAAAELERAALDDSRALQVLSPHYSANAYAYDTRYQNCNQWVAELMALAWGGVPAGVAEDSADGTRRAAQTWLKATGYEPSVMRVNWRPLIWLAALLPWVHSDDHPDEDLAQAQYRVSMPAALENFVRKQTPGATRVELCHTERQIVVRRGWQPIAEGCVAEPEDNVIALD